MTRVMNHRRRGILAATCAPAVEPARGPAVDSLLPDYCGTSTHPGPERLRLMRRLRIRPRWRLWSAIRTSSQSRGQFVHRLVARSLPDLEINCGAASIRNLRKYNRKVRVVFAGTRQVYGRPDYLPVDEKHLVRPADINGVNKAAGEYYHLLYNNVFDVRACSLRLTNVYGPRQLIKHNRQGFIGWFIRLALGAADPLFVDVSQLRDVVYVDDAADAFLRAERPAVRR